MNSSVVRLCRVACIGIAVFSFARVGAATALANSHPPADPDAITESRSQETATLSPADSLRSESGFDPSAHPGHVLYVDFWASWCAPCKASFPWMKSLQERFTEDGFEVIAINLDRDRQAAEAFLAEAEPNFAVVFDPRGKLAETYDLQGMPTTLLFDREGTLRTTRVGFKPSETEAILAQIEALLEETAPTDRQAP